MRPPYCFIFIWIQFAILYHPRCGAKRVCAARLIQQQLPFIVFQLPAFFKTNGFRTVLYHAWGLRFATVGGDEHLQVVPLVAGQVREHGIGAAGRRFVLPAQHAVDDRHGFRPRDVVFRLERAVRVARDPAVVVCGRNVAVRPAAGLHVGERDGSAGVRPAKF